MKRLAGTCFLLLAAAPAAADALNVKVGVLREPHSRENLSILDIPAADDTLAGALLGAADNNTTGKFTNQSFEAIDERLEDGADIGIDRRTDRQGRPLHHRRSLRRRSACRERARQGERGAPSQRLGARRAAAGGRLPRQYHPYRALARHADGWPRAISHLEAVAQMAADQGVAREGRTACAAYRRAAKKFGAKIVEERVYEDTGGGRRSDSGSVQTQRQMPVLTQSAPAYDALVAVDESDVFAGYLPFRTWDPRPVVGSAGLYATSWDPAHEQWGAHQLQNRFMAAFRRLMNARDNNAWLAMRMIGEAATRTGSNDLTKIRDYMLGEDFSIAAFKGVKLTLRAWNQQLRQPILLSDGRMVVSVSPQEGFLHQFTELDTICLDQPETKCRLK